MLLIKAKPMLDGLRLTISMEDADDFFSSDPSNNPAHVRSQHPKQILEA